mmetsp:Transcript_16937/g.59233  ORF Transcript_16937/g.59233 Transcript_16937/m.59233 type:complete len:215 (+) Transcript_16937:293-937(+)
MAWRRWDTPSPPAAAAGPAIADAAARAVLSCVGRCGAPFMPPVECWRVQRRRGGAGRGRAPPWPRGRHAVAGPPSASGALRRAVSCCVVQWWCAALIGCVTGCHGAFAAIAPSPRRSRQRQQQQHRGPPRRAPALTPSSLLRFSALSLLAPCGLASSCGRQLEQQRIDGVARWRLRARRRTRWCCRRRPWPRWRRGSATTTTAPVLTSSARLPV